MLFKIWIVFLTLLIFLGFTLEPIPKYDLGAGVVNLFLIAISFILLTISIFFRLVFRPKKLQMPTAPPDKGAVNWKRLFNTLFIPAVLIVAFIAIIVNERIKEVRKVTPHNYVTKQSTPTPSAKISTPSAQDIELNKLNCVKATKEAQTTGIYTNTKYKYSFNVPAGYYLSLIAKDNITKDTSCIADQKSKPNADIVYIMPIKFQNKFLNPKFYLEFGPYITIEVVPNVNLSLESWVDDKVNAGSDDPLYKFISKKLTEVAGEPALELVFRNINGQRRNVITKKIDRIYSFDAPMDPGAGDVWDLTNDLDKVLSTFKFLD